MGEIGKARGEGLAELLVGVADGLAAAHEAGILHRDIKPANILVAKNGYAKLADFGLAKLVEPAITDSTQTLTERRTRPGVVIGTIPYMSPEQASGLALDARSDIFSFGSVLYELLAGNSRSGVSDLEILQKVIHAAPRPLGEEIPLPLRNGGGKGAGEGPAPNATSPCGKWRWICVASRAKAGRPWLLPLYPSPPEPALCCAAPSLRLQAPFWR